MTRIASLSHSDIARHAARGRQLHSRAVRTGFAAFGRWVLGAVSVVLARRAFSRGRLVSGPAGSAGCGAHA